MVVGFTGTRKGLSVAQAAQLRYVLALLRHAERAVGRLTVFAHGGCVGSDVEAAALAREHGYEEREYMPYAQRAKWLLDRNRRLVRDCHVLVAAPETDKEQLRSGTWATVRYARKAGKPVVMLSRGEK